MTQTNNEREALLDKLLAEYWDIAYSEGNSGLWHGEKAQSTLNDIRKLFKTQSPISQNERQEVVAYADASLVCTISTYMIKELESKNETNKFPYHLWPTKLYTSPKQIPEWIGLSQEARAKIIDSEHGNLWNLAKAIESKLRELNAPQNTSLTSEINTEVWE